MALRVNVLLASIKRILVCQDRKFVRLRIQYDVQVRGTDGFLEACNRKKRDLAHDREFLRLEIILTAGTKGVCGSFGKGWGSLPGWYLQPLSQTK
jgi:hypothetical protein